MEPVLVLRIAKTIIGIFGILGNGLVCFVIYRVKDMHSLTNTLIFNQAVIDFISCLFMLVHSNVPNPSSIPQGLAGKFYCQLWNAPVLLFCLLVASTFNLIVITLERYFAIIYPFRYLKLFTRRKSMFLIAGVWIVAFAYKLNDMARYDQQDGQCITKAVSWKIILGVIQFAIQYFLPLTVMMIAYGHIMIMLRNNERRIAQTIGIQHNGHGPSPGAGNQGGGHDATMRRFETLDKGLRRARRNTFKTLLLVYVAFLICWTPNQIIFFLWNLGLPVDNSSTVYRMTVIMASSNSAVNFIIYGLKYRQFRQGVRRLFGWTNAVDTGTTYVGDSVTNAPGFDY